MHTRECCSISLRMRPSSEMLDLVSSWCISVVDDSFCLQTGLILLCRTDSLSFETLSRSVSSCWSHWILWTRCPPLCSALLVSVQAVNIIWLSRQYFHRSTVRLNRLLDLIDPIFMIWLTVVVLLVFRRMWSTFLSLVNAFITWEAASNSFSFICRGLSDSFHCPCVLIPAHVAPQPTFEASLSIIRAAGGTIVINDFPFQSFKFFIHQVSSCMHSVLSCSLHCMVSCVWPVLISETFEVFCNVEGLEKLLSQLLLIVPVLCSILSLTQLSFIGDFCKLVVFSESFSLVFHRCHCFFARDFDLALRMIW